MSRQCEISIQISEATKKPMKMAMPPIEGVTFLWIFLRPGISTRFFSNEYLMITDYDQYVSEAKQKANEAFEKAYALGLELSKHRKVSAKKLEKSVVLELKDLDLDKASFEVLFEELNKDEMMEEYIMLALRGEGLNLDKLQNRFGNEWITANDEYLSKLINKGFIIKKNNFLKFTNKGYALCDEILANMN